MATRTVRDGEASRDALLDAATELFAEQGVLGASIRSINRAAGLGPAAIHYHFGSREALLNAVVLRQGEWVMNRTLELATQLSAKRKPAARAIVGVPATVFRELLIRDGILGIQWMRILGQLSLTGEEHLDELSRPATELLIDLLGQAFPQSPRGAIEESLSLALTTFIQLISQIPPDQLNDTAAVATYVDTLAEFVTGGLQSTIKAATRNQGLSRNS